MHVAQKPIGRCLAFGDPVGAEAQGQGVGRELLRDGLGQERRLEDGSDPLPRVEADVVGDASEALPEVLGAAGEDHPSIAKN